MRAHIIENGTVINTIEVDNLSDMPGLIDGSTGGGVGDLWDGEKFIQKPRLQDVPEEITRWQALTILNRYGLYDAVRGYVTAIPTDTQAGLQAQIDFEAASVWKRAWEWLNTAAAAIGLTNQQVDQMFIEASAL